jgi:hypothetical protein
MRSPSVYANPSCPAADPCDLLRLLHGPHRVACRLLTILLSQQGFSAAQVAGLLGYDPWVRATWIPRGTRQEVMTPGKNRRRTYLYGRRMYQTMVGWETMGTDADQAPLMPDVAEIWRAADKVVYSTTLEAAASARTRIERAFDPEAIRRMKASAGAASPWWCRARRPGHQGRAGRRVPAVPYAHPGGAAQRPSPTMSVWAGVAGRTPLRQRRGVPPVPHPELSMRG